MNTRKELKSSTAPVEILQAHTTPKLAKKITSITFGKPEAMRPGDPDRWIMDVMCQVTGGEWVTDPLKCKYGPYWLWKGYFRATELKSGSKVDSPTAILPEIAASLIDGAREGGKNDGQGQAQNVMLAIRLGTTTEGRVGQDGYAWTAKLIRPAEYESPIDAFERESYGLARPQLGYDPDTGEVEEAEAAQ